jgi:hypothetical protein
MHLKHKTVDAFSFKHRLARFLSPRILSPVACLAKNVGNDPGKIFKNEDSARAGGEYFCKK